MFGLMESLEHSFIAVYLRNSILLYPALNTAHILGFSLLVGANLPRNLMTAITGKRLFPGQLSKVLRCSETVGLLLALLSGIVLFSTRATGYALSAVFIAKMVFMILALTTSFISSRLESGRTTAIRIFSSATAVLWLAVLTAGRFIAYF